MMYPIEPEFRLAQERACKALYVCGQCGKTQTGSDICIPAGGKISVVMDGSELPRFGCECGHWLEPLEFEDLQTNGGCRKGTPEATM